MSRKSLQPRMQPIDKLPEFLMPGTQASIRWDGVFLKLLPTWARGRKKDRYAYYAYVKAGRAHRVNLADIKAYVLAARAEFWKSARKLDKSRVKHKIAAHAYYDHRIVTLHKFANRCHPDFRSEAPWRFTEWEKKDKAAKKRAGKATKGCIPLSHGTHYRVWIDDPLAYIVAEPSAGADFHPFSSGKGYGSRLSSSDRATIVKAGAIGQPIRLPARGYTLFVTMLKQVCGAIHSRQALEMRMKEMARAKGYATEIRRVIDLDTSPSQGWSSRIAGKVLKELDEKTVDEARRYGSTFEIRADALWSQWVTSGAFDRRRKAMWDHHRGDYGPMLLIGALTSNALKMRKPDKVHRWLRAQFKKAPPYRKWSPFVPDPTAGSFLGLDKQARERGKTSGAMWKYWQKNGSWLHKSSTIFVDSFTGVSAFLLSKKLDAKGGKLLKEMMDVSRTVLQRYMDDAHLRRAIRAFHVDIKALEWSAAKSFFKGNLNVNLSTKPRVDLIDDVIGDMERLGRALSRVHTATPAARANLHKAAQKFSEELSDGCVKWSKRAAKVSAVGSIGRGVISGIFAFHTVYAAIKRYPGDKHQKEFWTATGRLLADIGSASFGFLSDAVSLGSGAKMLFSRASSGLHNPSRTVGASRVLGIAGACLGYVTACIDLGFAVHDGKPDKVAENFTMAVGQFLIGAGFVVDGTVVGAPVGILLTCAGFALTLAAGTIGSYWAPPKKKPKKVRKITMTPTQWEAMSYCKLLYKDSARGRGKLENVPSASKLLELLEKPSTFQGIPDRKFIVAPKARANVAKAKGGKRSITVETYRVSWGVTVEVIPLLGRLQKPGKAHPLSFTPKGATTAKTFSYKPPDGAVALLVRLKSGDRSRFLIGAHETFAL